MTRQLTNEDVLSIRRIYTKTQTKQKLLAELFKVSQAHISRIVNGLRRNTQRVAF